MLATHLGIFWASTPEAVDPVDRHIAGQISRLHFDQHVTMGVEWNHSSGDYVFLLLSTVPEVAIDCVTA